MIPELHAQLTHVGARLMRDGTHAVKLGFYPFKPRVYFRPKRAQLAKERVKNNL